MLVLATVAAVGSCVLSTSAFTQGPPPPPGIGGPPPGGPPGGGFPGGGPPGGGPPVAGLPHGGPPVERLPVAASQPAIPAAACAALREALVSIAAGAIAQVALGPIPDPTTAGAAGMAIMALLPLALLLVTPTAVPPTVTRVTPTATRAAIGQSATRPARAGTSEPSMSANDVAGVRWRSRPLSIQAPSRAGGLRDGGASVTASAASLRPKSHHR